MKKVLSLILCSVVACSVFIGSANSGAIKAQKLITYGADNAKIRTSDINIKYLKEYKPHELSDEKVKEFAREKFGDAVASNLLYRYRPVEQSMNIDENSVQYTASPVLLNNSHWSGYVAVPTSGSVDGVYGYFNAKQASSGTVDAPWLGIGGFNTANLIQAGVNISTMKAWYELLPAAPVYLFNVGNNNNIYVSINYDYDYEEWFLYISASNGNYYQGYFQYQPERTADFVFETVVGNHLGTFGTINFTNCWYTKRGSGVININAVSNLYKITMTTSYSETLTPSNIGSDGRSFSFTK